jgi:TonB family protein
MRSVFFSLLAILFITRASAQGCNKYVAPYQEASGDRHYAFKSAYQFDGKKKKTSLNVAGFMWGETFALVVSVAGADNCTTRDRKMMVTFLDGSQLELLDDFGANCQAKLAFFFSDTLKTIGKLKLLKTKRIMALKAWTSSETSVETILDSAMARNFQQSINCLAEYFGKQPPEPVRQKDYNINMTTDSVEECTKLLYVNDHDTSFHFSQSIPFHDEQLKLSIALSAHIDKKMMELDFISTDQQICSQKGDTIVINFLDGTRFIATNELGTDCERYAIWRMTKSDTSGLLAALRTKKIKQVSLYYKGGVTSGNLRGNRPQLLKKAFNCLYDATMSDEMMVELKRLDDNAIFIVVEAQPEFEGGKEAMMRFIQKNLNRPKNLKITGSVYVQFVVDKDGAVREVKTIRGLSPEADAEAVRLVSSMPRWKPGRQNGKPVQVRFVLPILFK